MKIDFKKLIRFILTVIMLVYCFSCFISYTIKTDRQVKQYEPKETIIIKR